MVGNTVRNFYEAESYFKGYYQGSASAYEFIEAKKTQWEHLIALSNRANATAVGMHKSVDIMDTLHRHKRK